MSFLEEDEIRGRRPVSSRSNQLPTVSYSKDESAVKYSETTLITNPSEHKLSLLRKLCFAAGGLPFQMTSNALALYIAVFLLEIAGIRPAQVSIILFTAKGWDALSDPVVGFFVNRTNTRFGKLRPWILFASPVAVVAYMMIWYVPDISKDMKTIWYLFFFCIFQSSLSCLHVPFTSLTMYITPNQAERDSATGFRMMFEVVGVLAAATIEGAIISAYSPNDPCAPKALPPSIMNGSYFETTMLMETTSKASGFEQESKGYLLAAGIMAIIYIVCCLITFFGTEEVADVIVDKNTDFLPSVKQVFRHKSYITLLMTFLFNSLAVQLVETNIALYCKYSIAARDEYQYIIIVLLSASIISLPIWQQILLKKGKKTAYALGLIMFIPNLFALLYIEKPVWLMYIIAAVCGLSVAVSFLCPWSMLPDVIDEFMLKTGQRKEPIFYSFYVFFTKLATGLAIAVSQIVLELSGYQDCADSCCIQPSSINMALRMLVVPGPMIFILLALIFLWRHSIDEDKRKEIKDKLILMRHNNAYLESLYE